MTALLFDAILLLLSPHMKPQGKSDLDCNLTALLNPLEDLNPEMAGHKRNGELNQ
jgi:hypothetical protein